MSRQTSESRKNGLTEFWWFIPILAVLLVHALSFRFVIDDAFISFRYAQNLIAGHGLVFNPGIPVEGYSNLLWVLLSAAGMKLGIDALLWARILGSIAMAATLLLIPRQVHVLEPGARISGWVAPLVIALCGPIACWMLAGLETPLFTLLTVLAWYAATSRRPLIAGVTGLALALTRPDGPLLAVAFLIWSLLPVRHSESDEPGTNESDQAGQPVPDSQSIPNDQPVPTGWRRWIGPALFIGGMIAHLLWRHSYYGEWLPNTYFAKTGDLTGQLKTGFPYSADFLRCYIAPFAGLGIWALVRGDRRLLRNTELNLTLLVCLVWFGYTIAVGGDMLGMFRFYVPILPLVITAAVATLGRLLHSAGESGSKSRIPWIMVILAVFFILPSTIGKERRLIRAHMSQANLGGWFLAGDALAQRLPRGATIALGPAGYIPYKTGLKCYDFYGITEKHIAHRSMAFRQGYAGHEKHDGDYIVSLRPDYILLGNVDVTNQPRRTLIPPLNREVDIVQNQTFLKEYEMVNIPLAGGKYLNCFKRKSAP